MKIGFIGLGRMGSAMAGNLLKAGHEVRVWNRTLEKADPLLRQGAQLAGSPREAADAEIVITMLADDGAVERAVFGADGIGAASPSPLHISMSTISIALAERLDETGRKAGGFVSAPVFGRPAAAEAAQLFVVAAGKAEAIERCSPVFGALGQKTFVVADRPPAANLVKLCGNFMIMAAIEAMSEALTLAHKGGVEKHMLLDVLTGTLFAAPIYRTYGDILIGEKFRPAGFAAPLGLKDMNLASAAADSLRVPMPLLGIVRNHLLAAIATEGEDIDWAAIGRVVERNAGTADG